MQTLRQTNIGRAKPKRMGQSLDQNLKRAYTSIGTRQRMANSMVHKPLGSVSVKPMNPARPKFAKR